MKNFSIKSILDNNVTFDSDISKMKLNMVKISPKNISIIDSTNPFLDISPTVSFNYFIIDYTITIFNRIKITMKTLIK